MDAVYLKNRYSRLFNIRLRKRVRYGADRCLVFASTTNARRFYHSFSPDQQRRLKALCRSMPPQPVVASLSPNVVVAALQRGQLQVYLPRGAETAGISGLRAAIGQALVDIFAHENTETVAFFLARSEDAGRAGAVHERLQRLIRTQLETSWYNCWEDPCAWHRRLRDSLAAVEYKVLVEALGFDVGSVPIAMIAEAYEVALLIGDHEETRVTLERVVRGHARFQPGRKATRFTGGALFEITLTAVLVMLTDRAGVASIATGRQPPLIRSLKQLGGLLQDLAAQLKHGKLLSPGKAKEAVAVSKPSTLADYATEEAVPEPDEPPGGDVDTGTMPPEKGVPDTKLSFEARLILAGDAKRAQIVTEIGKEIEPTLAAIRKLDPNAKIGFRGSLAGGLKGPHKLGPNGERVAFDGTYTQKLNKKTGEYEPYNGAQGYDLDFFVVSDKLASQFGKRDWFRNLTAKNANIRDEFAGLRDRLNNNPNLLGLKQESIDVRVWTTKQIQNKVNNGDPQIYFFNNKGAQD